MTKKSTNPADAENQELNQTPPKSEGEKIETPENIPKFSKEQLLKSNWYSHRRDALNTLLEEGKMYSHSEVEQLIESFMKGKVK